MPAFNRTSKLFACFEDAIVVFLIVHWSGQAVSGHTFCERWKGVRGVFFQEGSRGRGIPFGGMSVRRGSKMIELILSCIQLITNALMIVVSLQ